ncbi:MAG TPA: class I SAM-dependent methyltransferase [Pseudonocardiaceae bacterium]|nr:class I SAM-dependent methyltransferase [Pseudonocardiaceae bacterium]
MDTYNDYDGFARAYTRTIATNSFNAHYERPAALDLAGDVRGLRVLDAGCGPGLQAEQLIGRGATLTGIDLSAGLLEIARDRLGPDVPLRQADLAQPLDFADGSFDLITCSLVLHYLEDWVATLREFHRVLAPGGRVVMSTHHPFADMRSTGTRDYFGTYRWTENWAHTGENMRMRFWHRPLRAMLAAFSVSGFAVEEISEPEPSPELAELDRDDYEFLRTEPLFILFGLRRPSLS